VPSGNSATESLQQGAETIQRHTVRIGGIEIGPGYPAFVTAEIGINHNGDLEIAKELIDAAAQAGCNAVKFQKRTPDLCVPPSQQSVMRETPWGYVSYLDYREHVEFGMEEYQEINDYCRERGILWFASCWDEESVGFMERFDPPCFKIQSAAVTDTKLLGRLKETGKPLILSTGMSTVDQIKRAVALLDTEELIVCHSTSTYPCPPAELNLRMIKTLSCLFPCPIGYSGHEVGLIPTVVAVALGASLVERHITLDRSMWGSDQAASVEPVGMNRLVHYIRVIEESLGDGIKQIYESELPVMKRLRRSSESD
jgi:N-acetylneuraminate synthase